MYVTQCPKYQNVSKISEMYKMYAQKYKMYAHLNKMYAQIDKM